MELFHQAAEELREFICERLLTIRTPEGLQIELHSDHIPNRETYLKENRKKIIEQVIKRTAGKLADFNEEKRGNLVLGILDYDSTTKFLFTVRLLTQKEQEVHPIFALQELGMPNFNPEEVTDPTQAAQEQADFIRENQIRFLNRRGVLFNIQQPQLSELGYNNIRVRRNSEDQNRMNVDINATGLTYTVAMDNNYNFDLEGKQSNSNEFRESLRYIVLRWLNPVLCEPTEKIAQGQENYERQIYSRMGHLRLLPEGQNFGRQQVEYCLAYENRDLPSLSAQRKLLLNTTRNTTYVRPVERNANELPPITIPITDNNLFINDEPSNDHPTTNQKT